MAQTLLDKIWDAHVVARRDDGRQLIYLDRHVLHELHAPEAFRRLESSGRSLRRPDLTFGVQDHTVSTQPGRDGTTNPDGAPYIEAMRAGTRRLGIHLFDVEDPLQGISHVVAPELGLVLPGSTYACPDSHACTVGGLGALALACGTSELEHVLATQTLAVVKPKQMRLRLSGIVGPGVSAKDVALFVLRAVGVAGARGHAIEYCGEVIDEMGVEGRLTLCNLAIEMGARTALVAPDEATISWLAGRPYAPSGPEWDLAAASWRGLRSDGGATFDREVDLDCGALEPQITWGTDPSQVVGVTEVVPDPARAAPAEAARINRSLAYMDLAPGAALKGLPIDRVFIGSCTNSRLSDLRAAARIIAGGKVAPGVIGLVVPGSTSVKRAAEDEGLDQAFLDAGFIWGESGCSMCAGGNGDVGAPGERCISTTNRNFEGRQGRSVRTHLVSPETAAACALSGVITDVRSLIGRSR